MIKEGNVSRGKINTYFETYFPSIVFYLRTSWRRNRCLTVTRSWVWLHHVTGPFSVEMCGNSGFFPQSNELAGLDVKGCLSLCQIVVVQGVTHLSPCGSRDSESSIRASVFSFQTLGSSLNPKQLEFHFATVGYQSVIVKYMIYWVWEIISPSRWFLLIEILLSVSNLSIRAGSSLGGRSREGQFPVFETSNDSNNNFISKTTFIFRTITKNVPTLFVKIVKNRLCINFD